VKSGTYRFDVTTGMLQDQSDELVGRFSCDPIGPSQRFPSCLGDRADTEMPCIVILESEVMAQIQDPANADAFFVLPSQLNGAEYVSHKKPVTKLAAYKKDNTGGPRGQLSVHPAAGQFVLDNAARDDNIHGINAVDELLRISGEAGLGLELVNGYLQLPEPRTSEDAESALNILRDNIQTLRLLVMSRVLTCGITRDKKHLASSMHRVSLVYASAVPLGVYCNKASSKHGKSFHAAIAELVITAEYFGALRQASRTAPVKGRQKIYLLPLGGGVFNNSWESIAKAMALAVEMLDESERAKLEIFALVWYGNPWERKMLKKGLKKFNKYIIPKDEDGEDEDDEDDDDDDDDDIL